MTLNSPAPKPENLDFSTETISNTQDASKSTDHPISVEKLPASKEIESHLADFDRAFDKIQRESSQEQKASETDKNEEPHLETESDENEVADAATQIFL